MYPILFNYKIITIGTYGIMLGLAFYMSFLLMERELELMGKDPELAYKLLLAVIPSAVIGAKIFHILENMNEFLQDPTGMIFSGAGLSVYGGFVLAIIVSIVIIRINGEDIFEVMDAAAPAMALGYAIGRIGCHVSGDGCYGIATKSILGTAYPNGIVPNSSAVFATPLFESFFSFLILVALMKMRKKEIPAGMLCSIYFILNGIPRFSIEFIRLNPKILLGMTQAQLVAILFIITGIIGVILTKRKHEGGSSEA